MDMSSVLVNFRLWFGVFPSVCVCGQATELFLYLEATMVKTITKGQVLYSFESQNTVISFS